MKLKAVSVVLVFVLLALSPGIAQENECEARVDDLEERMSQELENAETDEERIQIRRDYEQRIEEVWEECQDTVESNEENFTEVEEVQPTEEVIEEERTVSYKMNLPDSMPEKCKERAREIQEKYSSELESSSGEELENIREEMHTEVEQVINECADRVYDSHNVTGEFDRDIPENRTEMKARVCGPLKERLEEKNERIDRLEERIEKLEEELEQSGEEVPEESVPDSSEPSQTEEDEMERRLDERSRSGSSTDSSETSPSEQQQEERDQDTEERQQEEQQTESGNQRDSGSQTEPEPETDDDGIVSSFLGSIL